MCSCQLVSGFMTGVCVSVPGEVFVRYKLFLTDHTPKQTKVIGSFPQTKIF